MTVLWTLLIVVGAAMIIVAVWPSIRAGRSGQRAEKASRQQSPQGNADSRHPPAGGREP
jgi:hypothetical protein